MAPSSTEPSPCRDTACTGEHAPEERVALASSLCGERGARLTAQRRKILELLWEYGRPTGAYELIEALKREEARPVAPPTVYRALQFLMAQGFVSRIESLNAYVPCVHPERRHDCLFFICHSCGTTSEIEDSRVGKLLSKDAAELGFRAERCVVEVEGTCSECVEAAAS